MKRTALILAALLMLSAVFMASCEKSEFSMTENEPKHMLITAKKAAKDSFFMVGSLEVDEGETIEIASGLESGSIKVEIIGAAEDQSIEDVPETDGEPVMTAECSAGSKQSGTFEKGSYMVRATCTEKATGTVEINVLEAE